MTSTVLYNNLLAAGLPVQEVTDDFLITMGPMTKLQKVLYNAVVLNYFQGNDYKNSVKAVMSGHDLILNYENILATIKNHLDLETVPHEVLVAQVKLLLEINLKILYIFERAIKHHVEQKLSEDHNAN
jgi:hypothetical protein